MTVTDITYRVTCLVSFSLPKSNNFIVVATRYNQTFNVVLTLIKIVFLFYLQDTFQSRRNKVKTWISGLYLSYFDGLTRGSKNEFFAIEQVSQKITCWIVWKFLRRSLCCRHLFQLVSQKIMRHFAWFGSICAIQKTWKSPVEECYFL